MSATITCRRCNQSVPGFPSAPVPGESGVELLANTCPNCFKDWMNTEVMIINEYRLDLGVQRNQDLLNQEMARFLNLPSSDGQASTGAPAQATPQPTAPEHAHGHGHDHGKSKGGGSCC